MLLLKAVRFATLVIMPIALTFLLRGSSFIRLWMGQQYAGPSGHVLWILALALMFMASDQISVSTMLGSRQAEADGLRRVDRGPLQPRVKCCLGPEYGNLWSGLGNGTS
jgi:hypothetical protein